MRDGSFMKSKVSVPMSLLMKCSNVMRKNQQKFPVDCAAGKGRDGPWRTSFSVMEESVAKKSKTVPQISNNHASSDRVLMENSCPTEGVVDPAAAQVTKKEDYKVFVSTWNVGGKSPPSFLNLDDWLNGSTPADIYVLGFQEIVPLNVGSIFGRKDNGPAKKWLALIGYTLNNLHRSCSSGSYTPNLEFDDDVKWSSASQKTPSCLHRHSVQSLDCSLRRDRDILAPEPIPDHRHSFCGRVSLCSRLSDLDSNFRCCGSSDDETISIYSPCIAAFSPGVDEMDRFEQPRYCMVMSKQLVGIFLTIWVRNEIKDDIRNLKVSCVSRGLMGCLGNKGSISVSMSLHQTSFCFVCSHLSSGEKEANRLRRNLDVMEILRKTRFLRTHEQSSRKSPQTILEHDRIIWLGDLNYRIALPYRTVRALVQMSYWKPLLEKDQLRIEQICGRVFKGWNEGRIYFPPTYKYSSASDRYTGDGKQQKEKRRTPAWCDRILWYGNGLKQLSYVRGESMFSDHRPVFSIFTAEVELVNTNGAKKCSNSSLEAEEPLPFFHGYTNFGFFTSRLF